MNDHRVPSATPPPAPSEASSATGGSAEPIAIIGIGCVFPKAPSLESYWRNIKNGTDGITEVPASHWRLSEYFDPDPSTPDMTYGRRGGFLDAVPFDTLEFGIAPKNLEATDTTQLFALLAARDALRDAGYATDPKDETGRQFDRSRTCVVLGVTGALELVIPLGARLAHPQWRAGLLDAGVDPAVADDVVSRIGEHFVDWQENSFPGLLGNVAAGRVANRFDLGGTNCVVDAACASSLSALHLAVMELQTGRADVALSGGIDTFNDIFMYMCFSKTPALSATGDSRPFDHGGDGTILGEGAGVIALKRLGDAERDGDRIRAVIRGIGSSSDGRGNAIYAPSAAGQQRALRAAYADAGVTPDTVELFEAHGTGTRVGDAAEVDALTSVFGDSERTGAWCALGSVKSMIGHTKAAAGIAGLIKAALALEHKVLPPTLKVDTPLANLASGKAPVYVNTHSRPWVGRAAHPRRASLSAFGFGGSNFHCVLEEHQTQKADSDWSGDVTLVAVSAPNTDALIASLRASILPLLEAHPTAHDHWQHVRAVGAKSRAHFDANDSARTVLIIVRDGAAPTDLTASLSAQLSSAEQMLSAQANSGTAASKGVHIGLGAPPGRLAVLFPGQGAQRPDMLKDLACLFPDFLSLAEAADGSVARLGVQEQEPTRLSDILFPHPAFSAPARQEQADQLRNTALAQPALGTVELASWRALERFGVQAEAFAGHSFGELVALAAARRLGDHEMLDLAALRGRLMAGESAAEQGSDRGSMLAVGMAAGELRGWLDASGFDLVIANLNGPRQTVLSGNTAHIGEAAQKLKAEGVQAIALQVSAAFHSPLMHGASAPFAHALEELEFPVQAEGVSVYANASAQPYPEDAAAARALLAGQLTRTVRFTELVENMHAAGFRTFLEVGPGRVLSSMTQNILAEEEAIRTLTLDASGGRGSGEQDLAEILGALAALGYPLDLVAWDPVDTEYAPASAGPAVVMISGANMKRSTPPRAPAAKPAPASQPILPAVTPAAPPVNPSVPFRPASETPVPRSDFAPPSVATTPAIDRVTAQFPPAGQPFAEEAIRTLARMQEQTAELHKQYLDGVAAAHLSIQSLVSHLSNDAVTPVTPTLQPAPPANAQDPTPPITPTGAESFSPTPALGSAAGIPSAPRPDQANLEDDADRTDTSSLVMEIVAQKTGYPLEMLRPEMELDADLGIDSIKRVEILSALQETLPGTAEPAPDALVGLVTLADVARLVGGNAKNVVYEPDERAMPPGRATPAPPNIPGISGAADDPGPTHAVLAIIADKTGYPPEMLSLSMQLDADLGIDSIKRVEILSAVEEKFPGIVSPDPEMISTLQSLADIVALIDGSHGQRDETIAPVAPPAGGGANDPSSAPKPAAAAHGLLTGFAAETVLLRVVAEKTGYPTDLLGLDMHMEADLGIDSIKRVEILSALEEELGVAAPADPEALAQLDTLRAVLRRLEEAAGGHATVGDTVEAQNPIPTLVSNEPRPSNRPVQASPPATREPMGSTHLEGLWPTVQPLTLGNRRLLSLPRNGQVWVVDDGTQLAQQICQGLGMHGLSGRILKWDHLPSEAELESQTVSALVLLYPTTRDASSLAPDLLGRSISLVQQLASSLKRVGTDADAVLVGVTRLGGEFGFGSAAPDYPDSAAIGGLVKSLADEWPEVSCKVVDIPEPSGDLGDLAGDIVDEMLLEGPLEVGLTGGGRVAVGFQPEPLRSPPESAHPNLFDSDIRAAGRLSPGSPVIVTGGARGITAAFALGLAQRTGCIPVLLGRTVVDSEEPEWLADASDDSTIQRRLSERSDFSTPAALARACTDIRARREVRATLARFSEAGLKARYQEVDVRDADAVRRTIRSVQDELGPIRGLVHGAGVIADWRIEDKTSSQVEAVYDTKVRAFEALLGELESDLELVCVFSSSSARYGRRGQTDYSAANEVVNKKARALKARRPHCRVASFNWGPWDGGMVTPELARVFIREGVGLIDQAAGVQWGLDQLLSPSLDENCISVEVVVGADTAEQDSADPEVNLELARTLAVSVKEVPVLRDHVLAGKGVVPLVLSNEWLIQAAMHHNPGLYFHGVDNLQVLSGLRIDAEQVVAVDASASRASHHEQAVCVDSILASDFATHVRGQVILSPTPDFPDPSPWTLETGQTSFPERWAGASLYDGRVLFHGPSLQAITQLKSMSKSGISGLVKTSGPPAAWLAHPWRSTWVTDPMAIDASFQLMVIWCLEYLQAHSLPTSLRRYRQYVRRFPAEGAVVECQIVTVSTHRALADLRFTSSEGKLLATVEGYESIVDPSLARAYERNRLTPAVTPDAGHASTAPDVGILAASTVGYRGQGRD